MMHNIKSKAINVLTQHFHPYFLAFECHLVNLFEKMLRNEDDERVSKYVSGKLVEERKSFSR